MQRYRQSRLDPHPAFMLLTACLIVYVLVAAPFVYWLGTSSTKIGYGGTVSPAGQLVWFGPLLAWVLVYAIGRRGPFSRLWIEPIMVSVTPEHLLWSQGHHTGSTPWDVVARITPSLWENTKAGSYAAITSVDGNMISKVPVDLTEIRQRRWPRRTTTLMNVAVAIRPDRFRIERHGLRRVVVSR